MKYIVLVSAVVMQMCLGATYSWSVYVQPLKLLTGLQQGAVQIPFTVFYFIFPCSMMLAGRYIQFVGTRRSALIGGVLFGGGWVLAGFGQHNYLLTIVGIGLLSGIGAGMAYIVPITVCVRWFPKNKGLVTGIAVAGFGGGAALVSQAGGYLMNSPGFTPFQTFTALGVSFTLLICSAGMSMMVPADSDSDAKVSKYSTRKIVSSHTFKALYLIMCIGLAAGFAINANLKELLGTGQEYLQAGILGVSIFALANAAGRIIWGGIFDRLSSSSLALQCNLFFQAAVFIGGFFLLESVGGYLLFSALTGFNYGGVLVLYVSTVSSIWGVQNVGKVYGLLFTSNIPASISPILAGIAYDMYGNFNLTLIIGGVLLAGASLFIRSHKGVAITQ